MIGSFCYDGYSFPLSFQAAADTSFWRPTSNNRIDLGESSLVTRTGNKRPSDVKKGLSLFWKNSETRTNFQRYYFTLQSTRIVSIVLHVRYLPLFHRISSYLEPTSTLALSLD